MVSNGPNLNPKQQELIERLERIRQRRNAAEQEPNASREGHSTERSAPRRQQQAPSRPRRNEQAPSRTERNVEARPIERRTTQPRNRKTAPSRRNEKNVSERGRYSPIKERVDTRKEQRKKFSSEDYAALRTEIKAGTREERVRKMTLQNRKSPQKNNLIKQLSDGNTLAGAIILSEILSKPVALRKK